MVNKKFFSVLLLLPLFGKSQNNGCIDSISFNRYYDQYFTSLSAKPALRDAADNFYINAGSGIGVNGYESIIKFNSNTLCLFIHIEGDTAAWK